jgi:16S rRNA (adenine1518-N6/adenine1519-N6)-dimethyltransferase
LIRARKRFGQHFLHDPAVIQRIIDAIAPRPGEALVEIGPGPGAITRPLLGAAGALDAIEIDRDLAAGLRAQLADRPGFVLHEADALDFDWRALQRARGQRLRLVGNLPYNISTPLLFRLLEARDAIHDIHFMLQKEVVERIVAAPGGRDYGRLGVMLAPFLAATRLFDIGPGAFQPPPRVHSSILRLTVREPTPDWAVTPVYGQVVAAAFAQRRKTLRNALSGLVDAAGFIAAGVDPQARAETLRPDQFGALARAASAVIH